MRMRKETGKGSDWLIISCMMSFPGSRILKRFPDIRTRRRPYNIPTSIYLVALQQSTSTPLAEYSFRDHQPPTTV